MTNFRIIIGLHIIICSFQLCFAQSNVDGFNGVKDEIIKLGIDISRERWNIVIQNNEITIYESQRQNSFFIIVNEQLREYVKDAVIAYSESNGFQGTESDWKENLIRSYSEQLRALKKLSKKIRTRKVLYRLDVARTTNIQPLIKTTWGQGYPYNEFCPTLITNTTHHLTGCVATALSQIMYYHKFPQKGIGQFTSGSNDDKYTIDFEKKTLAWQEMRLSYPKDKKPGLYVKPIADLMSINAQAVSSQFNLINTSSNLLAARSILVNHWKYAPSCKFMQNYYLSQTTALIINELNQGRPVLLSGGHHAFICDGYKDGFFHFNLGWNGAANGYYKLVLGEGLNDANFSNEIVKEIVFCISPDYSNKFPAKSVNIQTPGSLGKILSSEEKRYLRKLTISGKLNGQDVALLRRMLGATDAWMNCAVDISDRDTWTGDLQELNIEQVSFVKDNQKPFLRLPVTEGHFSSGNKEYIIGPSNNSDFEKLLKNKSLSSGDGYQYTLFSGMPCLEFYVLPNRVSPFMFYDCQNLQQIKLPIGLKEILGNAFQWCCSLRNIEFPSSMKYVETGAFKDCYLLNYIKIHSEITERCHRLYPFKTLGRYGEREGNYHKGIFEGNNIHTCKGIIQDNQALKSIEYKVVL